MERDPALRTVGCRVFGPRGREGEDQLAVEEPLECRIAGQPVATVLRTPGHDSELAIGFLYGEGWIEAPGDVAGLNVCRSGEHPGIGNVADLIPAPGLRIDLSRPPRLSAATASCGVCGKRTIEEVLRAVPRGRRAAAAPSSIPVEGLLAMPAALRAAQPVFERTGALHAAGLFDARGRLLLAREDVGRHNAMDKVVGASFIARELPLEGKLVLVSGRASFEIVQKALRAGLEAVAAISGVSSLARDLAEAGGLTLVGFLRGESFKVYAHPERISGEL